MEAIIIAFIVVIAATFVGGPLGWGIVLTAILYFVFETVSSNIQRSQEKMRKEMDLILNKNLESQKQIEQSIEEDDRKEEQIKATQEQESTKTNEPIKSKGSVQSMPETLNDAMDKNEQKETDDTLVNRVDAAAGVLDALDQHISTSSSPNAQ